MRISYDITQWTDKEKETGRKKIAQYKDIRETVQFGDLYRICSPYETNRSILEFVNKNRKEVVLFIYNLAEYPDNALPDIRLNKLIRLRGLEPEAYYQIEGMKDVYKGDMLMNIGIESPLNGAYKSIVLKITKL